MAEDRTGRRWDALPVNRAPDEWQALTRAILSADGVPCEEQPEAWWATDQRTTEAARRVCRRCPVRAECLDYAIAADERFGVWGGTTEHERREHRERAAG